MSRRYFAFCIRKAPVNRYVKDVLLRFGKFVTRQVTRRPRVI